LRLVANFLEFLDIHRPIRRRRHLDKMAQESRHVKAGQTGLRHGTHLEFGNFFPRPLVTVLFGYARAVRAFGFLERLFVQRWSELINLYSR
jgi:hypothetical protein